MKLPPLVDGEFRYAIAVREAPDDLRLAVWVKRNRKGCVFVLAPRSDRRWNPHGSYHVDGRKHQKSHGVPFLRKKCQPLTDAFRGTAHVGGLMGYSPRVGVVCDPAVFNEVVKLPTGVLGPHKGGVFVDLVEPGCKPMRHDEIVEQREFRDRVPWLVITVVS
jgi:hypothetical protein